MEWVILIVNEFRHIFSVLIAELLIVLPAMKKRSNFVLRLCLCIVGLCALCSLYALFYAYLYKYMGIISIMWYMFVALAAGAVIEICFEINVTSLFWVMLAAYAVEHFVYVLIIETAFIGLAGGKINFWIQLLTYSAVCACIYFGFYRLFKPNIGYLDKLFLKDTVKNRCLFIVLFIIFVAATMLNQLNALNTAERFNYLSAVSDLINCLFIIIVQFIALITSRINFEKQMSESLMEEGKRQYEAFKNSVDYINIKCHDLKHELAAMRADGKVDVKRIEEAESNLALYEAFAKTGNETLDILLTEKNVVCLSNGIVFSYMADASALGVMSATEIYVLFGNLLDNAVEYLKKVEDESKKFIRLFIKPQGNMLLIHSENYFCGDIILIDGLPQSTKEDSTSHGFGMKSMRQTAKKYGGDLKASVDGELFKVDIYIKV